MGKQSKIVYIGGISFFVKSNSDIVDLNKQENCKEQLSALKDVYTSFKTTLSTQSLASKLATPRASYAGKRYVTGADYRNLVIMSDWYGKSCTIDGKYHVITSETGTCAPTAATSIARYWTKVRGVPRL